MQLTVVVTGHRQAGSGVAELWCGSALLGILHEEHGEIVLRLESHAGGPLTVSAVALERALADAREGLRSLSKPDPGAGAARAELSVTTRASIGSSMVRDPATR